MNIRAQGRTRGNGAHNGMSYATAEDFGTLFESKRDALRRLALLLTGSSEMVEQTLSLALKDCRLNGSVSTDWMLQWARRAIVRNAIHLVLPPAATAATENHDQRHDDSRSMKAATALPTDIPSILRMPDFERLVFVITVLEHISLQDCALLMDRSPKEVRDAQNRSMCLSAFAEHDDEVPFNGRVAGGNSPCGSLI